MIYKIHNSYDAEYIAATHAQVQGGGYEQPTNRKEGRLSKKQKQARAAAKRARKARKCNR